MGLKHANTQKEIYSFGICCVAGLLFNGFTYNRSTGSIMPPSLVLNGKKYNLVKGFGVHWKRLREMVERELNGSDSEITNSN